MISNVTEIFNQIEKSEVISKELTDVLLELDVTKSVVTQASLNDMLEALYKRIEAEGSMEFEGIEPKMSCAKFIDWLDKNFTRYSYKLFMETIGKEVDEE